jgi:hypothetical protein
MVWFELAVLVCTSLCTDLKWSFLVSPVIQVSFPGLSCPVVCLYWSPLHGVYRSELTHAVLACHGMYYTGQVCTGLRWSVLYCLNWSGMILNCLCRFLTVCPCESFQIASSQ